MKQSLKSTVSWAEQVQGPWWCIPRVFLTFRRSELHSAGITVGEKIPSPLNTCKPTDISQAKGDLTASGDLTAGRTWQRCENYVRNNKFWAWDKLIRPCQHLMDNFHSSVPFFSLISYDDLWIKLFLAQKNFSLTSLDSTLLNCLSGDAPLHR